MHNLTDFRPSRWTWWTFTGWFVGVLMVLIFSTIFDGIGLEGFQFAVGLGMGGGVGYFQNRYLRKSGWTDWRWFWFSVLGMGAPFLLYDLIFKLNELPSISNHLPISAITGSIVVSFLQFRLLKSKSSRASLWMFAGILGWTFAMATVVSIDYLKNILENRWLLFAINLLMIFGGGVVLGVITGTFLNKIRITGSETIRA